MKKSRLAFFCPLLVLCLAVSPSSQAAVLFFEDFNSLALGPNVEESLAGSNVWTATPPSGWTVDRSGVPGFNQPASNNGVTEWIGWSFADRDWWASTAGDQQRTQFTKASGAVMVADPDEWDDQAHPSFSSAGYYDTFATTSSISLTGADPNSVTLLFDSSWRDECCDDPPSTNNQTATVTVSFDGGPDVQVLRWESDPASPNFKNDSTNETVTLPINNPAGAESMSLEFALTNAGNDWWWAVDNIAVFTGQQSLTPGLTVNVDTGEFTLEGSVKDNDINSYLIQSPGNSLSPGPWLTTNLEAQGIDPAEDPNGATPGPGNDPGETWETLDATASQLWEAFLSGSSLFDIGRSESLGFGYNTAIDERLVTFQYSTTDRMIHTGAVSYISTPVLTGDMDCDGDIDFDDIDDMVLGLNNPQAYLNLYGMPPSVKGDTDNDADLDFDDISGFVTLLSGGESRDTAQAVPEPSALALLSAVGVAILLCPRSRRAG